MTDDVDLLPQLPLPVRWAVGGFIRHAMVGVGVFLSASHVLPDATAQDQFVNWAVKGVLILGGLGWSLMNEKAKAAAPTP